jgi:hypothetical protein
LLKVTSAMVDEPRRPSAGLERRFLLSPAPRTSTKTSFVPPVMVLSRPRRRHGHVHTSLVAPVGADERDLVTVTVTKFIDVGRGGAGLGPSGHVQVTSPPSSKTVG